MNNLLYRDIWILECDKLVFKINSSLFKDNVDGVDAMAWVMTLDQKVMKNRAVSTLIREGCISQQISSKKLKFI